MRGLLRGLGWLFLVAVLLAAVVGVYIERHFSPEAARVLAVEQLTALLRREVVIERLVLTPRGLKIRGLRVRRGRVGSGDDLMVCHEALATVRLRPLLRRRLEFETVIFKSPQISLLRDAQGAWDLADVFGSSASGRGTLPLALAAAEIVIEDGLLRVEDRLSARQAVLESLSLQVDGFNEEKSFPVETSFVGVVSFGTRTLTTSFRASGAVDLAGLQWSSASIHAGRIRASVEGLDITGAVSVFGFSSARLEADLSVEAARPEFWARLGGEDQPVLLPATRWRVGASWPAPGMLDVSRLVVDTPAGAVTASGVADFAGPSPNLSVEISAQDFSLDRAASWRPDWTRRGLAGRANFRCALTGWPGRLQAREAELLLRGFGLSWGDRRLEGVDLEASAAEDFSKVKLVSSRGRISGFGAIFDDISLLLSVQGQNMVVERLAFRWGGSRARLRARVEHLAAPKEVVLSGSVDKLRWEDAQHLVGAIAASVSTRAARGSEAEARSWVRAFKYAIPRDFPDTAGRVRVGELTQEHFRCRDLDLLWSLRGVTQNLDRASGEARLRFGPGRVSDVPAVQDAHKTLRVIFLPFVFMHKMNNLSVFSTATAYPKTLDFNRIEGEYAVSRGVADTRYFHVDSGQLVAYAAGSADFGREKVDMNILTRLTGYRGVLPEWWVDETGRPAIGFRVKGDLNRPELEPRFRKIGEGELEKMVEEGRLRAKKRFEALEKIQAL